MSLSAIILAAGKATRMKSQRVKVLHAVCGRPMLAYVLDAAREAGASRLFVVIGHDRQRVMDAFAGEKDITWVMQDQQKGTGHAVLCARSAFPSMEGNTFVLAGDGPLIRAQTLRQMLAAHEQRAAAATLATAMLPDPTGYGRIVRDAQGELSAIVEHNDATAEQRGIQEVNPSYYLYNSKMMFDALGRVKPDNPKGEYYLTDTLAILRQSGATLAAVAAVPPEDVFSINSRRELALVNQVMQHRIQASVMESGVTLVSPGNTWIEHGAVIGADSVIEPFTFIGSKARIAEGGHIAPGSVVREP